MHSVKREKRTVSAVATEIPNPVAAATYAARQSGHFGKRTSIAAGNAQPLNPA